MRRIILYVLVALFAVSSVLGTAMTAEAGTLTSSSTTWTEDSTIDNDVTINSPVTVNADITLTIPAGKKLTIQLGNYSSVMNGITINDGKTLTIEGGGELVVNDGNGLSSGGYPCNGGAAISGAVIINGVTVTATGGNGSNGVNGTDGSDSLKDGKGGSQGGAAFAGTVTVNSGTVNATGGNGGNGGNGGAGPTNASSSGNANGGSGGNGGNGGDAFSGTVTIEGGTVTATGGDKGTGGSGGTAGSWDSGSSSVNGNPGQDGSAGSDGKAFNTTAFFIGDDPTVKAGNNSTSAENADPTSIDNWKTKKYVQITFPIPVASVTTGGDNPFTTNYTSLDKALSNWEEGYTLKLLADVSVDKKISVSNNVTLDLNGYGILHNTDRDSMFEVTANGNLTLKDSSVESSTPPIHKITLNSDGYGKAVETVSEAGTDTATEKYVIGGYITGVKGREAFTVKGQFTMTGGTIIGNQKGVALEDNGNGKFTMTGGKITMNKSGVEVSSGATFTMTGGEISYNHHGYNTGVGVYVRGTFQISGAPIITGNTKGDAAEASNVYMSSESVIAITGELTNTTPIGVAMSTPGVFTSGLSGKGSADNFTSDNAAYSVMTEGNELKLAQPPISYMAWDAGSGTLIAKTGDEACKHYTLIDSNTKSWSGGDGGFYVVKGDVTITDRVGIIGQASVILCDGATLTLSKGIKTTDNYLVIYAGSTTDTIEGTGKLIATGATNAFAGIGGNSNETGGTVTIYGGNITATGGNAAAGIGGGMYKSGGTVRIYGGTVTATGGNNAAMGIGHGGYDSSNGNGTLTLGKGLYLYGGTSANPENDPNNHVELADGDYARFQYMTVKAAPIVPASVTTAPTSKDLTYNGQAQELVTAGTASNGTMLYTVGEDSTTAPTSGWITSIPKSARAWTYYVWYKVSADEYYLDTAPVCVTVKINKATPTVTAPTAKTLTYNGQAQELVTEGSTTGGTLQYVRGNSTGATGTYSESIPTATEAGTYYVWYMVKGNENYNDVEAKSVTVTISKANPTVTAPMAKTGLVYDGSAQALVNAGSVQDGTMQYSTDGTNYGTDIPKGTNAGSYTVWYRVNVGANYNEITPQQISATIAKAAPTVTAPTAKTLTYTGSAQELVNEGSTTGGTLQYALGTSTGATEDYSTSIPKATDAGTYYVWYKVVGNENYNDVEAKSVTVTINAKPSDEKTKQDPTVTAPTARSLTYTGSAQELVTAGSTTGGTLQYALGISTAATGNYSASIPTAIEAGTYYVWYRVLGDENYNDVEAKSVTVIIKEYEDDVTTTANDLEKMSKEEKNAIKTLTLTNLEDLTKIDYSQLENLTTMKISPSADIETVDLSKLPASVDTFSFSKNNYVKTLTLEGSTVKNIEAVSCDSLESVDLKGNDNIESLDVSGSTKLKELNASSCSNLRYINCASCLISSLDIEACKNLISIDCSHNNLLKLDIDKLAMGLNALTGLNCVNQSLGNWKALLSLNFNDFMERPIPEESPASPNETPASASLSYVRVADFSKVKNLKAYDKNGGEIIVTSDDIGNVTFSSLPDKITYDYDTGFNDTLMDVEVFAADTELAETLGSSSGCGGCSLVRSEELGGSPAGGVRSVLMLLLFAIILNPTLKKKS